MPSIHVQCDRGARGGLACQRLYGQNYGFIEGGVRTPMLGRTTIPTETTLEEWASYVIKAIKQRADPMGGWAPHRSLEVTWGAEGAANFYYTAKDAYDLVFFPYARQGSHRKGDDDGVHGGLP